MSDARGEKYSMVEDVPSVEVINKRVQMFRMWFSKFEQLLIPVYAHRLENSCQHYTLLLLEKDSAGSIQAKYFESLSYLHGKCLSNAKQFLQLLGLDVGLIENKHNAATQQSQECGWCVCHWIEEYLRRAAGHPKQSQGWPTALRLRKLVDYLKGKIQTLEGDRLEWLKELDSQEKAQKGVEEQLKDKAGRFLKNKQLLQRIIEDHRAMAIEMLNVGAAAKPPELDAVFC